MKKGAFTVFVLLSLIFSACSTDNVPETEQETVLETSEVFELTDISYGPDTEQVYDIFLPKNRSSDTKVILLIHGGGWTSGDKSDMNGFYEFLKKDLPDIALVNMNYRLADSNNQPYPMQTDDISTLVKQLREKQTEYQISNSLGIIGVSAGGHLGLLWSYAFDTNNQVKMVGSIVGPTNLIDPAYQNSTDPVLQELIGLFAVNQSILEEASPHR